MVVRAIASTGVLIVIGMLCKAAFVSHLFMQRSCLGFCMPERLLAQKRINLPNNKQGGRKSNIHQHVFSFSTSQTSKELSSQQHGKKLQQTLASLEDDSDGRSYYEAEQVIKKSRFIGIAKHCTSWDEAQKFIKDVRQEHPKSRHACFGFVCGTNPVSERCSDDGEPTGTAGSPILNGINGEELSDAVCVVVRYSGGIKLGAGGLIRAYGGTARLVLREAERDILIPQSQINISVPSSHAGSIYTAASKYGGIVQGESYNEKGDLLATIICETENFDSMLEDLRDATRGAVIFEPDFAS